MSVSYSQLLTTTCFNSYGIPGAIFCFIERATVTLSVIYDSNAVFIHEPRLDKRRRGFLLLVLATDQKHHTVYDHTYGVEKLGLFIPLYFASGEFRFPKSRIYCMNDYTLHEWCLFVGGLQIKDCRRVMPHVLLNLACFSF